MTEQENAKGLHADLVTTIYRLAVVILLAGILIVQWQSMNAASAGGIAAGPTLGDLRQAPDRAERQELISRMPLVRVQQGGITVTGTVSIDSLSITQIRDGW